MASYQRIDTNGLKHDCPITDVVARYGIQLRRSGRSLVGRCPFHEDAGRPNLYVYPASESFYCFRCGIGGDVITFVERIEGVGFREAAIRLHGGAPYAVVPRPSPIRLLPRRSRPIPWSADEWRCLAAAVDLYSGRLLTDEAALGYVERRGIGRETLARCQVGYAAGGDLASYLRWRRIPIQAALRTGLLRRGGHEVMAGRIVVPEIRYGRPIWFVGRTIAEECHPKYLGLPGTRRLLGWERASQERAVCVVEGAFDWLTLQQWETPSLALLGTHVRMETIEALGRFDRVYLILDDAAGREATERMAKAIGPSAVSVVLPGVKDVADLANSRQGEAVFRRAIHDADGALAA